MEPKITKSPRKPGGGRLNRNQTVTVRLDERVRYFAELTARHQRRTLSSFIEWAIEEAIGREVLATQVYEDGDIDITFGIVADGLWDVDEADRFVKLACQFPNLLNYDEQVLWKLIKECPGLWYGKRDGDGRYKYEPISKNIRIDRVRTHWAALRGVSEKKFDRAILPESITEMDQVSE